MWIGHFYSHHTMDNFTKHALRSNAINTMLLKYTFSDVLFYMSILTLTDTTALSCSNVIRWYIASMGKGYTNCIRRWITKSIPSILHVCIMYVKKHHLGGDHLILAGRGGIILSETTKQLTTSPLHAWTNPPPSPEHIRIHPPPPSGSYFLYTEIQCFPWK